MRITKKHLLEDFERLVKRSDLNLEIEWAGAPQRPRIHLTLPAVLPSGPKEVSDLSPRLTVGDMHLWIEAFGDGFDHGWDAKGFALDDDE